MCSVLDLGLVIWRSCYGYCIVNDWHDITHVSCQSVSLKAFSCNSDVCVMAWELDHTQWYFQNCANSHQFNFLFLSSCIFINALGGITSSIKFIEMVISIWYRNFKVVSYNSLSWIYLHHEAWKYLGFIQSSVHCSPEVYGTLSHDIVCWYGWDISYKFCNWKLHPHLIRYIQSRTVLM